MTPEPESHIQSQSTASSLTKHDYVVLDVLVYVSVLWRRKWVLVIWAFTCLALSVALSYASPKLYEASVHFLPPVKSSASLAFSFSRVSESDQSRALLTSRTVLADVVEHQHLREYFKVKDLDQAVAILRGMARFEVDLNNFVTIKVRSKEPETSVQIANEFYNALYRLNERIATNEAAHRLNFMAGPMEVERGRLSAAEDALRDAKQKTGLVVPSAQANLGVQAVASLRQRLSDLESQLAAERVRSTDESPTIVTLRSRIGNLQGQVAMLEGKSLQADSPARLPELSMEVQRREREVQLHTIAMESLARSMQLSQMQESYTPSLSLIDSATPNKQKVAPSRKLYAVLGFAFGLFLGLVQVLGAALFLRWQKSGRAAAVRARWIDLLRRDDTGGIYGK